MKNLKKIFYLLSPKERKKAFFLLALTLIVAFLDMLGVASILPFIALLNNPNLLETNIFLNYIYQLSKILGVSNSQEFIIVFGVLVFLFLMITVFLRAFVNYYNVSFAYLSECNISKNLIEGYLRQPYSWFIDKNTVDLGKKILSDVNKVVHGCILTLGDIIIQGTLILALFTLLIATEPVLASAVLLFLFFFYLLFFYLIKNNLFHIGNQSIDANTGRFIILNEVFSGLKLVKTSGLEKIYVNSFAKLSRIYAYNQSKLRFITQSPRILIEIVAFGGVILLMLILMLSGKQFSSIISIITLFVFAGYRLIPALQTVFYSASQIRFTKSLLNLLYEDLKSLDSSNNSESEGVMLKNVIIKKFIKLNNINYTYPNSQIKKLININLEIPVLKKVAIIGVSGSGKTTLVDIILGLLEPNQGTLVIDDIIITNANKRSWQKNIGYVPQKIYLSNSSIESNIAFGSDLNEINRENVEEAAKIADIHDFIKKLPHGYSTNLGEQGIKISGGQQQRIGIARALYSKPQVLILDEASSALDNFTENVVSKNISSLKNKMTIIVIAHRLETLKDFDNIFLLEKGELKTQGTYEELSKNDDFKKFII